MNDDPSRREELIAAALAGELSDEEQREYERLSAADPSMASDLAELRATASLLDRAEASWREEEPPPALAERVLATSAGTEQGTDEVGTRRDRTRPRPSGKPASALLAGAAALLIVGGLGGVLVQGLLDAPPTGPPGTLGAREEIEFGSAPADVLIDAALVAHTWGTETVLEVDGLPVGETFEVVLVSEDGEESSSGTFLGTEETVDCRMNAAVLRENVSQVQIQDDDGAAVATSVLPDAGT